MSLRDDWTAFKNEFTDPMCVAGGVLGTITCTAAYAYFQPALFSKYLAIELAVAPVVYTLVCAQRALMKVRGFEP